MEMATTVSTVTTAIPTTSTPTMHAAEEGEENEEEALPPTRRKKSIHYIMQSRDKDNEYLKEFIHSDLCVEFQEKAEWRSWACRAWERNKTTGYGLRGDDEHQHILGEFNCST